MNQPALLFIGKGGKKEGMGHLVRIATLAAALAPYYDITVLVKQDSIGDSFFKQKGMACHTYCDNRGMYQFLERRREAPGGKRHPFSVIVVDVYLISIDVVERIGDYCDVLVNFDDMRRRVGHDIRGIFLCPQEPFNRDVQTSGTTITAKGCDFFPVRDIFGYYRDQKQFREEVRNIGIVLGGAPSVAPTMDLVRMLDNCLERSINLHAVMGFDPGDIDRGSFSKRVRLKRNVDDMAEFIARMDMGIIAGGFVKFEFMCIGTPFLLIARVRHQEMLARGFSKQGYGVYLGTLRDHMTEIPGKVKEKFKKGIIEFIEDVDKRKTMFEQSRRLVDGEGTSRIAAMIDELLTKGENNG
jgi:spore coat polysaccharide biosynthesis predicted glycosyltransferase SpsG